MKEIKVIVATHKKYEMPKNQLYLPLQVGKAGKEYLGYETDDTGKNISEKNSLYCELTALYWAWKNLDSDYIGLVHYRRYFSKSSFPMFAKNKYDHIISDSDITSFLAENKVIVPKKRNYYIESIYSHYAHTHYAEHLDKSLEIIKKKYPKYEASFEAVMKSTSAHMFNMFIMSKENLDSYCQWLFDILFELENVVDISEYSDFQKRYLGRVSEILFNVWLKENTIEVKELPYLYLGKVKLFSKGISFLRAKFQKKKFDRSF